MKSSTVCISTFLTAMSIASCGQSNSADVTGPGATDGAVTPNKEGGSSESGSSGGSSSGSGNSSGSGSSGGSSGSGSSSGSSSGGEVTEAGSGADEGGSDSGGRDEGNEGGSPTDSGKTDARATSEGGTTSSAIDYAPYFPTWVWGGSGYAFTGLADLEKKSGLKEVTIAFVLSNGGCNTTQDIEQNMSDVSAFRAAGGHVKASFGGADGTYIEAECTTASTWAGAIEDFVDDTGITDLDFDIEQDAVLTDAVNEMRGQALAMVQQSKGIKVAFTLAANPSPGALTSQGQSVVSHAIAAGVVVSHVNLMTMDYGDQYGGQPLAPVVEGSLTVAHTQMMSLFSGISSAAAWGKVGVIPMLGKNDDSEVFSLDDAKTVTQFAITNQIGLVSFWSIDRDQPGTDYNNASTVETTNFAFDDIFQAVTQ